MKKYLQFSILIFVFILFAILFSGKTLATACNGAESCASISCSGDCPVETINQVQNICRCTIPQVGSGQRDAGKVYNPVLDPSVGGSHSQGESIIAKFIAALINLFFIAGSLAVLVFFVLGGLAWITSEGDKGKMEIARNRLTYAVSGIAIIAASYAVLYILGKFLGIPFFDKLKIIWPTVS